VIVPEISAMIMSCFFLLLETSKGVLTSATFIMDVIFWKGTIYVSCATSTVTSFPNLMASILDFVGIS